VATTAGTTTGDITTAAIAMRGPGTEVAREASDLDGSRRMHRRGEPALGEELPG
jgi:hypothetical protein